MTVKRRERSDLAFSPLPPTVAPAVRVHQRASNIARLKPACSGFQMKTTLHLDELRSIRISVLVVRSVRVKDLTERFWMDVPGTLSRWCQLTIGNHCTGLYCPISLLHLQPEIRARIGPICPIGPILSRDYFFAWIAFTVDFACSLTRCVTAGASAYDCTSGKSAALPINDNPRSPSQTLASSEFSVRISSPEFT